MNQKLVNTLTAIYTEADLPILCKRLNIYYPDLTGNNPKEKFAALAYISHIKN